jgi:hypothetical protein
VIGELGLFAGVIQRRAAAAYSDRAAMLKPSVVLLE